MNLAFQDENINQRDIPQSFPQIEEYILQLFDAAELQGKTSLKNFIKKFRKNFKRMGKYSLNF